MDKASGQKRAVAHLYPPIDPFDQQMLDVGDGHRVYVEQAGNPNGVPVVVLHGGPGGGCSPMMRRYFDPKVYRIILFDQRGCGRSRPHASVENNTTWHLVDDIELIRKTIGVQNWIVFGGSWGATLALIYAQARLFSGDAMLETRFARAWAAWENALASIDSEGAGGSGPAEYARAFARLENYYFSHGCFLDEDQQILANMDKIAHIPGVIVQGRFDMICPPVSAYNLSRLWPKSRLVMIGKAGHALSEAGISAELIRTMDSL